MRDRPARRACGPAPRRAAPSRCRAASPPRRPAPAPRRSRSPARPICRRSSTVTSMPPIAIVRSTAFSMSNKVRQATETAVSASISTPVDAHGCGLRRRRGSRAGRRRSRSSPPTLVSGSGWQSGIRSAVRLAAIDAGQLGGLDHRALGRGAGADLRRASPARSAASPRRSPCGRSAPCPVTSTMRARPSVADMAEPAHAQRSLSRGIWPASEQGR